MAKHVQPRPTRRTEVFEGFIDGVEREALDALYTLHYWAHRLGDTTRCRGLEQAITLLDPASTDTPQGV
jgi:hypothetical protein